MPLANKPLKAYLLAAKDKDLEVSAGENGLTIQVPAEAPDKIASVIALELEGKPQPFAHRLRPAADGTLLLNAADAEIEGSAKLEEHGGEPNIGFWLDPKTTVSWNVDVPAGEYNVGLALCRRKRVRRKPVPTSLPATSRFPERSRRPALGTSSRPSNSASSRCPRAPRRSR